MAKKKKENKYFSFKSYLSVLIIGVIAILAIIYCIDYLSVKKEERLMNSYLISTSTLAYEIKDLTEVEQVLKESPSEYFVLISYTNDEKTYKLEKKLKKYIDNYNLNDKIYYINVTDMKDDSTLLNELDETFNTKTIVNIPCMLYYKDNLLEKVLVNEDGVFTSEDFKNLIEEYDL